MANEDATTLETMADLLRQLGSIAPGRIRLSPSPGKAKERDLVRLLRKTDRLYELVDGTLVEKVMGFSESYLACNLIWKLRSFLEQHNLGIVVGPDGAVRLMEGLVRLPDVSFLSWDRLPVRGEVPSEPIVDLAPDLAVEVISKGNTRREMQRKLKEYFLSGVRLVWFVDPGKRCVEIYTSPEESSVCTEDQTLNGGEVLPGLDIPLEQIFAQMPAPSTGKATRKRTTKKRK